MEYQTTGMIGSITKNRN